jgi:ATP phosphoribosyltransferase
MKIGLAKGRIEKNFCNYLKDKEIIKNDLEKTRKLIIQNGDYQFCLLKSEDIINLLLNNCIDIGILGSDVIEEIGNNKIETLTSINSVCYFALATLKNKKIEEIKTIATKYPNTAIKLLKQINMECNIIKMNGSLEIAPNLEYADAIIDLVETGNTLKENNLEEKIRFNNINTQIIKIKNNENEEIKRLIKKLK